MSRAWSVWFLSPGRTRIRRQDGGTGRDFRSLPSVSVCLVVEVEGRARVGVSSGLVLDGKQRRLACNAGEILTIPTGFCGGVSGAHCRGPSAQDDGPDPIDYLSDLTWHLMDASTMFPPCSAGWNSLRTQDGRDKASPAQSGEVTTDHGTSSCGGGRRMALCTVTPGPFRLAKSCGKKTGRTLLWERVCLNGHDGDGCNGTDAPHLLAS